MRFVNREQPIYFDGVGLYIGASSLGIVIGSRVEDSLQDALGRGRDE